MSNIQLALFLEKYRIILSQGISEVADNIPNESRIQTTDFLGRIQMHVPILEPLYDILSYMDDDITFLKEHAIG